MSYFKRINNSWLFGVRCLLICSVVCIQSCSDDEEEEVLNVDSQITFKNITPSMTVWNSVPISLEVSDDKGITSVQVLVDGVEVAMLTAPPFEVAWDASSTPDGLHTIKVVVTDKAGNTTVAETTVTVQNTLVTIDIAADQLSSSSEYVERGFVFLSDGEGNLIASSEYTNGNDVILKAPYGGTEFFLTEVLITTYNSGSDIRLWTFPAIERGQTWTVLDDREYDDGEYLGEANISFTGAAANTLYEIASMGDYNSFDNFQTTSSVRLRTAPSKLYVTRRSTMNENGPVAYRLYTGIVVGDNAINLSQVNQQITKLTATMPEGATYGSIEVKGYDFANDYSKPYRIGGFYQSGDNVSVDVFYPGAAFPSYYSEIGYETDDADYYSARTNTIFEIADMAATVSFDFANEKLTYTTTGDFSLMSTTFTTESEESAWSLFLPAGTGKVIPSFELPAELETFDLPVFGNPQQYTVYDFEEIDGYDELKSYIRSSTRSADALFDDGKNYTEITRTIASPGGRSKKLKKSYSLRTAFSR